MGPKKDKTSNWNRPVDSQINPQATFTKKTNQAGSNQSTASQQILDIATIQGQVIIMKDGSLRSVMLCRPVNFDLMSPAEKEAIEYSYQGFLNSLYFPIQIVIRSRHVDAENYLDKLIEAGRQQNNMLLGVMLTDYLEFLATLLQEADIMDKSFYVIVPYSESEPDSSNILADTRGFFSKLFKATQKGDKPVVLNQLVFDKSKSELSRRCQSVLEGLSHCGVSGVILETEDLIELFYESYNPDAVKPKQPGSISDILNPVVAKGQPQTTGYDPLDNHSEPVPEPVAPTQPEPATGPVAVNQVAPAPAAEAVVNQTTWFSQNQTGSGPSSDQMAQQGSTDPGPANQSWSTPLGDNKQPPAKLEPESAPSGQSRDS